MFVASRVCLDCVESSVSLTYIASTPTLSIPRPLLSSPLHHIQNPSPKHYIMIPQMSQLKLVHKLFVTTAPRLRMPSYKRFTTTQARFCLIDNAESSLLTCLLRETHLKNSHLCFQIANQTRTMDAI